MVEIVRQTLSMFAQAVITGPSPTAAHEMPPITAAAMTPATTPTASLVRLATTTPPFGIDWSPASATLSQHLRQSQGLPAVRGAARPYAARLSTAAAWSSVMTPTRREDAERFIEEVRGDEPEVAEKLRIEERELDRRSAERSRADARS
jgi:hypothetical protein